MWLLTSQYFQGQIKFFTLLSSLWLICLYVRNKQKMTSEFTAASNRGEMQGYVWKHFYFLILKSELKNKSTNGTEIGARKASVGRWITFDVKLIFVSMWSNFSLNISYEICSSLFYRLERWRQNISEVSQNSNKNLSCQMTPDKLPSSFQ